MKLVLKFRLFALPVVMFVLGISISNLAAEFLRPSPFALPAKNNPAPSADQISSAWWASAIAPFRSDLKAEYALVLASETLKSDYAAQTESDEKARNAAKEALKIGPHDARVWLVLALLQAHSNLGDPLIAEALKMSYFTGPNRAELIPARLNIATLGNSLNDTDLKEIARGDVRAVLAQYPDQRQTLVSEYVRASSVGKAFLENSIRMYDPKFADSLTSAK